MHRGGNEPPAANKLRIIHSGHRNDGGVAEQPPEIHLVARTDELRERMTHREGHFMPSSLLPSQLADLEPLADDEDGVTVVSRATPEQTLDAILAALEHA